NTNQSVVEQGNHSLSRQMHALCGYAQRKEDTFLLQIIIFLAILSGLVWAGRKVRSLWAAEAGRVAPIFDVPIATALVLSLLASSWLYPQAPRMLWAILG